MLSSRGTTLILSLLLALGALAGPAAAQVDLLDPGRGLAPGMAGEVGLTIESVGLNNTARPGEWVGIRIRLIDRGDRQRDVLLRVVIPDADGDPAHYETVVTTNPGIDLPVWTYVRLPFDIAAQANFRIQAFAAEEGEGVLGYVAGRLLGQIDQRWSQNVNASSGFIGVLGVNPGGLPGYMQQWPGTDSNPLGHEATRLIPLRPESMPDRWLGLAMLRELVWNGVNPADLRIEQVRALREWVERGGHLVVVLPAVGQDWLAISNQELASMMPVVSVTRLEAEPLNSLRPLLTDAPAELLPLDETPVTLHVFEPLAEAEPGQADCVLNDAAGRCVVVSRAVGVGAVTLVGLPAWHQAVAARAMPEADVFWHRVLGRRGHIATQSELQALQERDQLNFRPDSRHRVRLDSDLAEEIAKSGRSLAGVMLGLVVFVVYWVIAGPGGYALLKRRGWSRHAWLGFLGASLAFTALAWGGATLLKPKRVEISHLSVLDHVYGERVQRVKTWASVLVPVYGDATVALESDDAAASGSRFVQAVAPWEPPQSSGLGSRGSFPDQRAYTIDARSPEALTFPARSTVKQVQMDWAGGLAWESISPIVGEDESPFGAIRFTGEGSTSVLEGRLVHGFPGRLENVHVVLFREQAPVARSLMPGLLLARVNSWYYGEWEPGQAMDLEAVTALARNASIADKLKPPSASPTGAVSGRLLERFQWLAFYNLTEPPDYAATRGRMEGAPLALREASHGLDLSRWSTRPSVVVLATLSLEGENATPAPVRVATNGDPREPWSAGATVVRWVYPLPPDPPPVTADVPAAGGEQGEGG